MDSGIGIIILAMVAVFLVARLYKVLGRRTGQERRPDPFAGAANDDQRRDAVLPISDRARPARADDPVASPAGTPASAGTAAGPLQAGVARIRSADPQFDPATFVAGARTAFEWVLGAFASGDAASLRPLLNDEVFDNFNSAIKARQQAKETLQTTLVGITSVDLIEADLQGRNAVATVKIVSDQINVTRDAEGKTVEGDPSTVAAVTDIWTFARNTRSRDLNWTLIATRSPN
jgi:predicted lipid-binding transport protein (Tim44 family)